MIVEKTIESSQVLLREWRQAGMSIALVPTMGFFHAGHLALMKKAGEVSDKVVVSLFVNPTQFAPHEDLDLYPQDFAGDCLKAEQAGVDLIFSPDAGMMYNQNHETSVSVHELTKGLCGRDRPEHFKGVTTVVAKLFNIIQPDYALFGEKDFQQLVVIRRMVNDLNFPVKIGGHPIVREDDGIAMSSRNAYLSSAERTSACVLYKAMQATRESVLKSAENRTVSELISWAKALISEEKNCSLEYFSIVDEDSLQECDEIKGQCRAIGAIRVNQKIRLIDNIALY